MPVLLDQFGEPMRRVPDGSARTDGRGIALPGVMTFISRQSGADNTFWADRYDEAMRYSREKALDMNNDTWLQGIVNERMNAVASLEWQLEVPDNRDPRQRQVREGLTRIIKGIPNLHNIIRWLNRAVWFGRYGVQVAWEECTFRDFPPAGKGPVPRPKKRRYQMGGAEDPMAALAGGPPVPGATGVPKKPKARSFRARGITVGEAWPVNGDKIGHQHDHTPYVMIDASRTDELHDANIIMTTKGMAAALHGTWRERFIIHQHEMEDADFYHSEQAEGIHGVGLRSKLFWYWWLKWEWLGNIANFFERVGLGVTIWYYPTGNDQALSTIKKAAAEQNNNGHIFVPRDPDGGRNTGDGIERVEVPTAGADALRNLIEYLDGAMERMIIGQEASSRGTTSGMGNEAGAKFQENCVPLDSEILTRGGFKSCHDVQIGEEVLAYDVEGGVCRWTPLLDKTFFDDAAVTRMATKEGKFEAVCTPQHSWAMERPACNSYEAMREFKLRTGRTTGEGKQRKPQANRIPDRYLQKTKDIGWSDRIVLAAPEVGSEESILTPVEAAILGWVVTDGTVLWNKDSTVSSFRLYQSKEEHFEPIRKLCRDLLGRDAHEWVGQNSERTFPIHGKTYATKPQHIWTIPAKDAQRLANKCGFRSRTDLPRIAANLNHEARAAMLKAMMDGDGHKMKVFFNGDNRVMEAFEILAALEGYGTSKPIPHGPVQKKWLKRETRHVWGRYLSFTPAGRCAVWCPTTQYGTWVMRQNNRVMITGNTKAAIILADAKNLAATLTGSRRLPGLVNVIKKYTYPWAKFPVTFAFNIERQEADQKLQSARALIEMGVDIKADDVRRFGGFGKPDRGDEVVKPPAPPGAAPTGIPGGPPPGVPAVPPPSPNGEGNGGSALEALRMQKDARVKELIGKLKATDPALAARVAIQYAKTRAA